MAYRDRVQCAHCAAALADGDEFLSSDGPICGTCHRRDAQEDRDRTRTANAARDVAMHALFATGAGLSTLLFAALTEIVSVRALALFAVGIAIAVRSAIAIQRAPEDTPYRGPCRALAWASAAVAMLAFAVLAVRVACSMV